MGSQKKIERQFLDVYDSHADAVFRHCYFRVYSRERAKEIMQEAFMRAWECMAAGQEIQNLKALVYKIANNLVIDESRKKKEQSLEALHEAGFDPGQGGEQEFHEYVDGRQLLKQLDLVEEEYRQVVYMRFIDDLKPKEIAEVLGESVNVISVRIHRGVAKLRQSL